MVSAIFCESPVLSLKGFETRRSGTDQTSRTAASTVVFQDEEDLILPVKEDCIQGTPSAQMHEQLNRISGEGPTELQQLDALRKECLRNKPLNLQISVSILPAPRSPDTADACQTLEAPNHPSPSATR